VSIRLAVYLALLHYIWKVVLQGLLQSTCRMFMRRSFCRRELCASAGCRKQTAEAWAANGTMRAAETDYVLRLGRRMAMLVRNGTRRRGDATHGAEAVAPSADGDAQLDPAALASCFKTSRQG